MGKKKKERGGEENFRQKNGIQRHLVVKPYIAREKISSLEILRHKLPKLIADDAQEGGPGAHGELGVKSSEVRCYPTASADFQTSEQNF